MAKHLEDARRRVADLIEPTDTVRKLRLSAGLSQNTLAQLARTTQSYIARIEAGKVDPQTDTIERLAEALGIDPGRLFCAVRAQRSPP
jgi:predicted transcriptional regulator